MKLYKWFFIYSLLGWCPLIVALLFKATVAYARWNVYEPLVIPRVSAVKRQGVIENNFHGKFCVVRCGMTRKASPSHSSVMVARVKLTSAPALNDKAIFCIFLYFILTAMAYSFAISTDVSMVDLSFRIVQLYRTVLCKSNLTHQLAVPSKSSLKFRRNILSYFSWMACDIEFYFNHFFLMQSFILPATQLFTTYTTRFFFQISRFNLFLYDTFQLV